MKRTSVARKASRLCAVVAVIFACAGLIALSSPSAAATHSGPQGGGIPMHQIGQSGFHQVDGLSASSHGPSAAAPPRTINLPQPRVWPTVANCFGGPPSLAYLESLDPGMNFGQSAGFGYSQSATAWSPFGAGNAYNQDAMWWFGYTAGQMPGWAYPNFSAPTALGYCAAVQSLFP